MVLKWLWREQAQATLDLLGLGEVVVADPAPTELADVTILGHLLDYLPVRTAGICTWSRTRSRQR